MAADKSTDVLLPPEVPLTASSFQRQVVHGQHHHLDGSTTRALCSHHDNGSCSPTLSRRFPTCCQVSLNLSKLSLPSSEQSPQENLKKLSPFR